MEGGVGSNMTLVLQSNTTATTTSSSEVLDSLWLSNSSPSFHGDSGSGSSSMVNFTNLQGENKRDMSLFPQFGNEDTGNEDYDCYFHQPEKKRRLTADQVHFLEKNFEVENKLEPERKVQLAKELGLQPRQVAIWFQNRRARFKNKQLEKDYDALKARYDKLKAHFESLSKEKESLKNEVVLLTEKLILREKEKANSEQLAPINQNKAEPERQNPNESTQTAYKVPKVDCAQEEAISGKSDVLDSGSPQCRDGTGTRSSSLLEPADSSHVIEPDNSDFSQDEEDNNLSSSFLPHLMSFPKLEDDYCIDPPQPPSSNSCFLNLPVEEPPSWFWSY